MQGYGPINVQLLTVTRQGVNPAADRVLISNRSVYDVMVSFQATQPLPSNVLSTAWPVVVHAGDQLLYHLRTPDHSQTPLGQYWTGSVWLCPIGQQTNLALTGTTSGSTQVFVTELLPGDAAPSMAARPTNTDLSSQPRVISVPISGGQVFNGTWDMKIGTHQVFLFNQPFTRAQISAGVAYLYLYMLQVIPELFAPASAGARLGLGYSITDAGNNVIATGNMLTFYVAVLQNTTSNTAFLFPYSYVPPIPPFMQITVPPTAVTLFVSINWVNGGQFVVDYNSAMAVDANNVVALAPIGNNQQNFYPNVIQTNSPIF